jgi:Holliday junction resolvasome, helicase subunit
MARPPFRLGNLVGQRRVIEFLDRLVTGAMRLKAALPNILFCGPPGYGKSEIAMTISRPTGTTFRKVTASVRFPVTEFLKIFDGIKYGDVLFVDEAHALRPELQLLLCSAIEERRIPVLERTGKGIAHITSTDKLIPEFATFLATDQPDRLPHALRSRMAVTVELRPYTKAEMRAIVEIFCAAANLSVVSAHLKTRESGQEPTAAGSRCSRRRGVSLATRAAM